MKRPEQRRRGWDRGTARLAMNTLRAAFNWAATAGALIKVNPLALPGSEKLRTKRVVYKGKRTPITEEEHKLLLLQALKRAKKDFAYLVMFLHGTGARPAEMYLVKAEEWNEERKAFVIKATEENHGRFKLAHLGEDRVIYVPNQLLLLTRLLMKRHPTGPLFRTEHDTAWDNESICARFNSLRTSLSGKVRQDITAYSYRHAYVTRWLTKGRDPMVLCELLCTSLQMLHKHYSHLFKQHQVLRNHLDEFAEG